jgi:hypothetical protein
MRPRRHDTTAVVIDLTADHLPDPHGMTIYMRTWAAAIDSRVCGTGANSIGQFSETVQLAHRAIVQNMSGDRQEAQVRVQFDLQIAEPPVHPFVQILSIAEATDAGSRRRSLDVRDAGAPSMTQLSMSIPTKPSPFRTKPKPV